MPHQADHFAETRRSPFISSSLSPNIYTNLLAFCDLPTRVALKNQSRDWRAAYLVDFLARAQAAQDTPQALTLDHVLFDARDSASVRIRDWRLVAGQKQGELKLEEFRREARGDEFRLILIKGQRELNLYAPEEWAKPPHIPQEKWDASMGGIGVKTISNSVLLESDLEPSPVYGELVKETWSCPPGRTTWLGHDSGRPGNEWTLDDLANISTGRYQALNAPTVLQARIKSKYWTKRLEPDSIPVRLVEYQDGYLMYCTKVFIRDFTHRPDPLAYERLKKLIKSSKEEAELEKAKQDEIEELQKLSQRLEAQKAMLAQEEETGWARRAGQQLQAQG